jgi:PAS domain S-box-containing protein
MSFRVSEAEFLFAATPHLIQLQDNTTGSGGRIAMLRGAQWGLKLLADSSSNPLIFPCREEFSSLVNVSGFQKSILSPRFGETGYSFVLDSQGNVVVHPKLKGKQVFNVRDASGAPFIQEICRRKSGKIAYSWMNPGETAPRSKLVIFNYFPELDWIVASSSYLDEFREPLDTVRNVVVVTVMATLLLVLPTTLSISRSITNPLQDLMARFASGATGDLSAGVGRSSNDELGLLASYFNTFMIRLDEYSTNLREEIVERKQAEQAPRRSEEVFSKAFRSSPNGICIASLGDGRIIDANESLLSLTGYGREELVGRTASELGLFPGRTDVRNLMEALRKQPSLRGREMDFRTRWGELRTGRLSAELIELQARRAFSLPLKISRTLDAWRGRSWMWPTGNARRSFRIFTMTSVRISSASRC